MIKGRDDLKWRCRVPKGTSTQYEKTLFILRSNLPFDSHVVLYRSVLLDSIPMFFFSFFRPNIFQLTMERSTKRSLILK